MNRIYVSFSTDQLKSKKLGNGKYYLAYMLIRYASKNRCGGFNLYQFLETVQLKERAGKVLLNNLVKHGFVKPETKTHYRIVAQRSLFEGIGKQLSYQITDEDLKKFSLKRISYFRAFLSELEAERYSKVIEATAKGYNSYSQRDKFKERIRNRQLEKFDQLMALGCVSKLIESSITTASNYRKKQFLSVYTWKKEILQKPTQRFTGSWSSFECETGKGFQLGNVILYSPIATRTQHKEILSWRM